MKKNILRKNKLDINKYWKYTLCCLEEYNNKDCFYWFDTASYQMIGQYWSLTDLQKSKIDYDNKNRFVKLFQYINECGYKTLMKRINNTAVNEYFNKAKDSEDAYYRYRCFVDWNCLSEDENYVNYLFLSKKMIMWCEDNNIKYLFKKLPPPENYLYNNPKKMQNCNWLVPSDEYLYG